MSKKEITLHSEMIKVLKENGNNWMTTERLCEEIIKRGKYKKKRGRPEVFPEQIFLRARNYSHIFELQGRTKVRLKNYPANDYQALRESFKPKKITCLLIAESPPASKGEEKRFFYNPNCEKIDYLFKAIMQVLFPEFNPNEKGKKLFYLKKFQEKGFYLIDAVDYPINDRKIAERNKVIQKNLNSKIQEIKSLIKKDTPIILIKANIFELFYQKLIDEGFTNICNQEAIPFPSHGRQKEFQTKFKQCLEKINF